MSKTKEVQVAEPVEIAVVQSDSSEGLARMVADLAPLAARLKANALALLFISILFIGSLEGMLGFIAATGVLCCAAPGVLGTAHAARCTRILAIMAASLAFMHILCLSTFAVAVLPEVPRAFEHACADKEQALALGHAADSEAAPKGFVAHLVAYGVVHKDAPVVEAPAQLEPEMPEGAPRPTAMMVASFTTGAARRLQELAPATFEAETHHPCMQAKKFMAGVAPTFVLMAVVVEFALFIAALNVATAASKLTCAARRYGANGM